MSDTNRARLGVIVVAGLFVTALGAEGELWAENDGMDWALWGGWLR